MRKNLILHKAIRSVLAGAALAGASMGVNAQTILTPNGSGGWAVWDGSDAATLTGAASRTASGGIYTWDGHNNSGAGSATAGYGWGHNTNWYVFNLTTASNVTITEASSSTNFNPAFTVFASGGYQDPNNSYGNGHSYGHVNDASVAGQGPTPWLTDCSYGGCVTATVGYANSGPTGWVDGSGATVGSGAVDAGYAGTFSVSQGLATMTLYNLAAGEYVIPVGSDGACGSFLGNSMAACPTSNISGSYTLTLTQSAVPVPGAIWLFGSVLAGWGFSGRRKNSV
jgi:hypothetical protein